MDEAAAARREERKKLGSPGRNVHLFHSFLPPWNHGASAKLESKWLLPSVSVVEDPSILQLWPAKSRRGTQIKKARAR